jgi:hypothetical protein
MNSIYGLFGSEGIFGFQDYRVVTHSICQAKAIRNEAACQFK